MLNYYLKLSVFCVLLRSFGKISAIVGPTGFQLPFRARFDIYLQSLAYGTLAGTAGMKFDSTLKIDSLSQIRDTSEEFKKYCLWAFENNLKSKNIDYFSEDKATLGKFAFAALDSACKATVKSLRASLKNDKAYTKELELILYKGDILDFIVFLKNPDIPKENMEKEIERLQKKDKSMTKNEGVNRIILHKYNVGKILKNYPEPVMSILSRLSCFNV